MTNNFFNEKIIARFFSFREACILFFCFLAFLISIYAIYFLGAIPIRTISLTESAVSVSFLLLARMGAYRFLSDESRLHVVSFLKSGLFTEQEVKEQLISMSRYYSMPTSMTITAVYLLNCSFLLHSNNALGIWVGTTTLFLVSIWQAPRNVLREAARNTQVTPTKSSLIRSVVILITTILLWVKVPIQYSFDISSILAVANSKMTLNFFMVGVLILLVSHEDGIFGDKKQKARETTYGWIRNGVLRDFVNREVGHRPFALFYLGMAVSITGWPFYVKSLILISTLTFLYTQFNQRYILNAKFVEFSSIYPSVISKLVLSLTLKLAPVEIAIGLISSFFAFKGEIVFILIFQVIFLINIYVQSFIYVIIIGLRETTDKRLQQIEMISGGMTMVELILGLIAGISLW